jgi:luciferase family oxidoreductase group 1
MSIRLSVLDQTPVGEDFSPAEALRASVDLAEAADRLGFTRYWVAEHHNSPGFAGTAPEILAGALLARTRHLRVGTGGVLLPRYEPLKVAEVFTVLASVYPGRVDLGIGRAGGPAHRFPQQLDELRRLLGLFAPGSGAEGARPAGPQMWLLGAGGSSAALAGRLGTSFAFAHFLAPAPGRAALEDYRREYAASGARPPAEGVLAVRVVTADTDAKAEELAQGLLLWRSRKDLGQDLPLPSPATARRHRWTGAESERAAVNRRALVVGTPERVRDALTRLAADHGVGEIVVNTLTHDPEDRLRSHELLAQAFGLAERSDALATAVV